MTKVYMLFNRLEKVYWTFYVATKNGWKATSKHYDFNFVFLSTDRNCLYLIIWGNFIKVEGFVKSFETFLGRRTSFVFVLLDSKVCCWVYLLYFFICERGSLLTRDLKKCSLGVTGKTSRGSEFHSLEQARETARIYNSSIPN